jgi:hypothetical protein
MAAKKEDAIGRIAQTWELIGQSFAILKSDKELMLLPVFSGVFCILVSVVILGGGGLLFRPSAWGACGYSRESPLFVARNVGVLASVLLGELLRHCVLQRGSGQHSFKPPCGGTRDDQRRTGTGVAT